MTPDNSPQGHLPRISQGDDYEVYYHEKNHEFIIRIDMADFEREDINIGGSTNRLIVKAENSKNQCKYQFTFKEDIDQSSTKAEYSNGSLRIRSPISREKDNKQLPKIIISAEDEDYAPKKNNGENGGAEERSSQYAVWELNEKLEKIQELEQDDRTDPEELQSAYVNAVHIAREIHPSDLTIYHIRRLLQGGKMYNELQRSELKDILVDFVADVTPAPVSKDEIRNTPYSFEELDDKINRFLENLKHDIEQQSQLGADSDEFRREHLKVFLKHQL